MLSLHRMRGWRYTIFISIFIFTPHCLGLAIHALPVIPALAQYYHRLVAISVPITSYSVFQFLAAR